MIVTQDISFMFSIGYCCFLLASKSTHGAEIRQRELTRVKYCSYCTLTITRCDGSYQQYLSNDYLITNNNSPGTDVHSI